VPTYAYRCTACEHALEVQQSFTDDALTVCPACEGRLRKVFSAVGVVFKGSGFYRNDARSGGKTTSRTSGSSTSGGSTSTTTTSDGGTSTSTSSSTSGTATATKATTAAPAAGS
jgi:putative FmdB family regulatory protein